MNFTVKSITTAIFLTSPISGSAATIDLLGKTYESFLFETTVGLDGFLTSKPEINISAKLGESVTKSFAHFIDFEWDYYLEQIPATGDYFYSVYGFQSAYMYTQDSVTGFSMSNVGSLIVDRKEYFVFDLTFAPTAATVALDKDYAAYYPADTLPGTSLAELEYNLYYDEIYTTDGDFTYQDSNSDLNFANIAGVVLPSDPSVTPVPVPGAFGLMAIGLVGMGVLGRRRRT